MGIFNYTPSGANADQSQTSAAWADFKSNPKMSFLALNAPWMGAGMAIRGRNRWKRLIAEQQAAQDASDKRSRANSYLNELNGINDNQNQLDVARGNAYNAIGDGSGTDQSFEDAYSADLMAGLAGANEQYQGNLQKQQLNAVKRGVQGGSNDAEHQAELAAALESQGTNVVGGALNKRSGLYANKRKSRTGLRRSVLQEDPATSANYESLINAQNGAADRNAMMADFQNAFGQIRGEGQDAISRGYGGAFASIGRNYYDNHSGA